MRFKLGFFISIDYFPEIRWQVTIRLLNEFRRKDSYYLNIKNGLYTSKKRVVNFCSSALSNKDPFHLTSFTLSQHNQHVVSVLLTHVDSQIFHTISEVVIYNHDKLQISIFLYIGISEYLTLGILSATTEKINWKNFSFPFRTYTNL